MQITIYMGSRCNLNCAYCHREADANETTISSKLLKKLQKVDNLTVKLMGGEPTLYLDEIKKVVKAVPKAKFIICTNGVNRTNSITCQRYSVSGTNPCVYI